MANGSRTGIVVGAGRQAGHASAPYLPTSTIVGIDHASTYLGASFFWWRRLPVEITRHWAVRPNRTSARDGAVETRNPILRLVYSAFAQNKDAGSIDWLHGGHHEVFCCCGSKQACIRASLGMRPHKMAARSAVHGTNGCMVRWMRACSGLMRGSVGNASDQGTPRVLDTYPIVLCRTLRRVPTTTRTVPT